MKKLTAVLLVLILALSGCGRKEKPIAAYPEPEPQKPWTISKGRLTDDQKALLPQEPGSHSAVLTFTAREQADAYKMILFRLENGSWEDMAGGGWTEIAPDSWDAKGAASGTLTLNFDRMWEECIYHALIGQGNDKGRLCPHPVPAEDLTRLNTAEAFLTGSVDGDWEELVPIAVQAVSHQDRVYAPDLGIFRDPEAFASQGYEQVYLLAFSLRKADQQSIVETFP